MAYTAPLAAFGRDDVALAGGKAANLGELVRAGLPVPPGFVVTTEAYRSFVAGHGLTESIVELSQEVEDPEAGATAAELISDLFRHGDLDPAVRAALTAAYDKLGRPAVAVRSSATAEDLAEASFAGQQDTYLNVRGTGDLVAAVRDCWASLWTARALSYRARQGIDPATVSLAVVVQELVPAESAGVMFTANPANGRRAEAVISAAWGLGESVVSGSVDPDQVVAAKADGRVLSRLTADKTVETVRLDNGTEERPVPADRRRQPVLDDPAVAELVDLGVRIEDHFRAPQDIEWARTVDGFAILQSRPITALPPPEVVPPTDWAIPDPHAWYFRASIVEQLPDPLSPLFADFIDAAVESSLRKLFDEFVPGAVRPGEVSMPTINGYAYYAYDRSGMNRLLLQSPRALKVLRSSGTYSGQVRWRTYAHPRYERIVAGWKDRDVDNESAADLLAGVQELVDAAAEYYTSVQTIIPIAAISEVIFSRFYNTLVRRREDPPAATFLVGFDSEPIRAEKSLFEIAGWLRERPALASAVLEAGGERVVKRLGHFDDSEWADFSARLQAHLDMYGHAVYNLDFVNPVPADDPAPLVDTLRFLLRGEGSDPYERQQRLAARRERATSEIEGRLDPLRGAAFTRLLRWAQSAAPVREDALADVGLAWPALRRTLAELGTRLVAAGAVDHARDVFWVRRAELTVALAAGVGQVADLRRTVEERQSVWRGQRRLNPPQLLPRGTWMDWMESMFPAASPEQTGRVLRGVGASAGTITATARVLGGPEDFGQLQPGDILVAGITTPAWTSLFTRAAGVVTDVGGPLSHSSIVAREYGIPAVLGTGAATHRITSGQRITVDGDAGTVTLPDDAEVEAEPAPAQTPSDRTLRPVFAAAAAVAGGLVLWRVLRRMRMDR